MGTDNNNNSDLFDLNDDSFQSLDDLIADDNKAKDDADEIINRDKRRSLIKKVSIIGGSALLVCLLTGSLFLINPFGGDQNVGKDDKKTVAIDDDSKTTKISAEDEEVNEDEFYREKGKKYPNKLDKWQTVSHDEQKESELNDKIVKKESGSSLGSDANILPSESIGYTSDDSKEFLKDGSINPDYSYWTSEVYTSEAGEHIERLLNPTFGDWSRAQYSSYPGNKYFEFEKISDMFTSAWMKENSGKKYSEFVPVYADWDGNDYNMGDRLLSSGPRWYGEVTSSTSEFKFNEEVHQYTVDYKAKVKFTAWAKDQSKLEKTGTLTLQFVSDNSSPNDSGSKYKVLINKSSLKVDK